MTSDGSSYARFRRALETGNELLVLTAARELPQIALHDALRICLVLRDGIPSAMTGRRCAGSGASRSRRAR